MSNPDTTSSVEFARDLVDVPHLYAGRCPDLETPDDRDSDCPACQLLMKVASRPPIDSSVDIAAVLDAHANCEPVIRRDEVGRFIEPAEVSCGMPIPAAGESFRSMHQAEALGTALGLSPTR